MPAGLLEGSAMSGRTQVPQEPQGAAPAEAPWLAAQRAQLLAQRGHAWLLQGPSGLGQYELALSLAATLNAPIEPTKFGLFRM